MTTETDDFAAAFAEAVKVVETPDDAVAAAAQAAEMGTGEDPPAADDKGTPPPAADDKGTPPPAADDKGTPPPAADDKGTPPPAAEPSIDEQFPDPQFTEDEQKTLTEFEKNWDEIAPAFNIKLKNAVAAVEAKAARTIAKVVQNIYADFTPLINSHLKSEATSFRGEVLKAHDDYDTVYPKLDGWIKTHPAYLQSGLLKAYNEGTAEEVIDLVSRYKQAIGVKPQAAAPAASKQDEPKKPAAASAAALAPVDTQRTAPKPSGADPEDYDSAFDEAAASLTR
jgi:hypothetical protein